MARKVGLIYCQRIQDHSCVGCAKCYKAASDKLYAFSKFDDDVQIVFKTTCGDCPGLALPRVELQMTVLGKLEQTVDEIYFATCVKKATALMNCPMNLAGIKKKMEATYGIPVHVGTHDF